MQLRLSGLVSSVFTWGGIPLVSFQSFFAHSGSPSPHLPPASHRIAILGMVLALMLLLPPPETLSAFLAGVFLGCLCLLEGLCCLRVTC